MTKIKHLHYKDLNGFRFFAFLGVFIFINSYLLYQDDISAAANYFNTYGSRLKEISLEFFIFLSAFLLTVQGLREHKYKGDFSIKSFFLRRFLRIISVLIVALVFYFFIHPFIIQVLKLTPQESINPIKGLFLFPYYYKSFSPEVFIYTFVIWTIFMICQLYIILAILLKFFSKILLVVGSVFIVIGIIEKLFLTQSDINFNLDLFYYGSSIGIGIISGKIIRGQNYLVINWVKQLSNTQIQLIYAFCILAILLVYTFITSPIIIASTNIFIAIFFAFVIFEQTYAKHSAFKFRNYKLISRIGRISYGMTLFSPILAVLLLTVLESIDRGVESPLIKILFPIVTFIFTWIFSNIYFNLVESYFLSVKREQKNL